MIDTTSPLIETWGILELMGRVRVAGKITEESHFGTALGRIDIPTKDGGFTTQFFHGSSIYRLTPCSEDVARAVALHNEPEPVHRWELPAPRTSADLPPDRFEEDEFDNDIDDDEDVIR